MLPRARSTIHHGSVFGEHSSLLVIPNQKGDAHLLTYARPSRLRVRGGGHISLSVAHWYDVVEDAPGEWRVRTESYVYTIYDGSGRESFGYHYHPAGVGEAPISVPHLHIYQDTELCGQYLPKIHLRTGRIALEDVVELLVTDFDVVPRPRYAAGEAWRTVLNDARVKFARLRRWSSWSQLESDPD